MNDLEPVKPSNRKTLIRLPHDPGLLACLARGEDTPADESLAYFWDKNEQSWFYFLTPLCSSRFNPAIIVKAVVNAEFESMSFFRVPGYVKPGEIAAMKQGYFLIQSDFPKPIEKESPSRFINSMRAALLEMAKVRDCIDCSCTGIAEQKAILEATLTSPATFELWLKETRRGLAKDERTGFPLSACEHLKHLYALMMWDQLVHYRKEKIPGKRGGGWDYDAAAHDLNAYFSNRHEGQAMLKSHQWRPYTGRWLREFETNRGLSQKLPDGRKK